MEAMGSDVNRPRKGLCARDASQTALDSRRAATAGDEPRSKNGPNGSYWGVKHTHLWGSSTSIEKTGRSPVSV